MVVDKKLVDIENEPRNVITLSNISGWGGDMYWIEGVGSEHNSYITMFSIPTNGSTTELQECGIGDKRIFVRENFGPSSGVATITHAPKTEPLVFDMAGRPVLRPEKGRIYIVSGKKRVW